NLFSAVKPEQWNLFRPASDASYPWTAFALGYPVAAIAFFCTDQAMVQSVLGAKNLEQGQLGVSFIGWLKILSIPLFIIPGIICFKLAPEIANEPDIAYMTLVTKLFPAGLNGLVIVVMIAVLVGTIGSSLNALSTVFTTDIYIKKINPAATTQQVIRTGRITVIVGCVFAVITAIAVDNVRGLNLPDIFQAVLGFIAPPLAVVFLLAVFWKRTTRLAVNTILSAGSAFSLGVGVLYLWIFPKDQYNWPHYLLLSFYIFAVLFITAVIISLLDRKPVRATEIDMSLIPKTSKRVWRVWIALIIIMTALYIFFNGF
ncbi:MAG TPA: Na+/glucose cotransporter, partial [Chitinophagaceae bacterium]|nr:Na+/glucose cotransporter [Chitinophagaceae bacterium]